MSARTPRAADAGRRWPAPAKLNLFLRVTGRRADGYHTVQTAFQFLDFGDALEFAVHDRDEVRRLTNPELPADDLAVRAARLLKAHAGRSQGVDIRLYKRIPVGAGLGGGSSDAATTLIALDRLWGLGLGARRLMRLGARLGADVPVFVFGRAAWAAGVGDELTAFDPPRDWFCVVCPRVAVPSAEIFEDPRLTRDSPEVTIRDFLRNGSGNDLEAVTRRRYPLVDRALTWLGRFGEAKMTGSGAAVFLRVADRRRGEDILSELPSFATGFVARGVNRHPLASPGAG